jgi:copper chaperone
MQSTYTVTGMTCGHCVAHVTEEVQAVPGVSDVQVMLEGGHMVITSAAPVDFKAIKDAVSEAGEYEVVPAA